MSTPAVSAMKAVAYAISVGRLTRQPCEVCGLPPRFYRLPRQDRYRAQMVVAHHDDYAKPLEVRWLCRWHHADYHRSIGSYANNGKKAS